MFKKFFVIAALGALVFYKKKDKILNAIKTTANELGIDTATTHEETKEVQNNQY